MNVFEGKANLYKPSENAVNPSAQQSTIQSLFGGINKETKEVESIKTNIPEQKEKNLMNFEKAQKPLESAISSSGLLEADKKLPSEISMIHIFILNLLKIK